MLRSPSLKQRPKPIRHSARSEESQIHFEPELESEMFRYAQHDNGY